MKVNKIVCDQCKDEHDMNEMYFGGRNTWQEVNDIGEHSEILTKDFCSIKCMVEYYYKK